MTVTIHINPNDAPLPGKQSTLNFLFNDDSKKFHLADCLCTILIIEQGKHPHKNQLTIDSKSKPSIWGVSMLYTFPAADVYKIVLNGTPKKRGEFEPFTVSWYFRVDSVHPGIVDDDEKGPPDIVVLVSALGVVIVGLVLFGIFVKREFTSA